MRPPTLLLASLLAAAPLAAQPRRPAAAHVIAERVEPGPETPHCDVVHFLVPMRYRVRSVENGALTPSTEIEVIVSCPQLTGVRFTAGALHRLTLAPRRLWQSGAIVPWPGHPTPARRWWARALSAAPVTR